MTTSRFALLALLTVASATAFADQKEGELFFKAKVGSFKELKLSDDSPVTGRLELQFRGTLLVSGPGKDTKIEVFGGVRKEIDRPDMKKAVYFGSGKIVITGTFQAVQFFGRDIDGHFKGRGVFRFYGEFDKDLNTGEFWTPTDKQHTPWGTGGYTIIVPKDLASGPEPEVKFVPKSGSKPTKKG